MERQSCLLCGQIPERDLYALPEGLAVGSLVAPAGPLHAMNETGWMLAG
jgi:hypothetical protein